MVRGVFIYLEFPAALKWSIISKDIDDFKCFVERNHYSVDNNQRIVSRVGII